MGLALGVSLKFYTSLSKGLKLKVRKFWGLILTFAEVTGEKLVGGGRLFALRPILSLLILAIFPDLEMLKFLSVNYTFILDMSEILDIICICVLLINIESGLLLALVKYMLCSHFT